jgi:hypothetical protein
MEMMVEVMVVTVTVAVAVMILMGMGRMVMMMVVVLARDRAHRALQVDFLAGIMVVVTATMMAAPVVVDRLPRRSLQSRLPVHPTLCWPGLGPWWP